MASTRPNLPASFGNFDLIEQTNVDYTDLTVSKWQSRESGLTVVHLDYDAPIVKGYFVVATEIFNDSGCPHTLEHLVFMGSEKYPYKGVLDNLANRAFAAGTNAWTANDHTAYAIETAGGQGFLQLLPIYVDHILYPTIRDSGFVTEVHHINSQAEDAGVVYSEMQGRENTSGDLSALQQQRLFYPPNSAYRSETGGLMEALRKLTAEEIRQYHASYYVPQNLCLIVGGKLSTQSLLETVQNEVEPRIKEHNQANGPKPAGWKRPFMETPSADKVAITQTKKDTVEFPEKDESMGEVMISFVGPEYTESSDIKHDFLIGKALDILGIYLTDTAVAPLTKEFVEIPSPLCSYIYFAESVRASFLALDVYFGSVPAEHLDTIDTKFKESLQRIVKEGIDMERLKVVLKRDQIKLYNELESQGGDYFSGTIITDFLYGSKIKKDIGTALAEIERYKELGTWSDKQWADLLERFYINNNAIVIRSKPSAALADSLESAEKARVIAQREHIGPEGIKKLEKLLEEAKADHERPIPSKVLTDFPVPDVKSISWIPVQSARDDLSNRVDGKTKTELEKHIEKDGQPLPFFLQFDHVKSDFVTLNAYLSTVDVPGRLRPYFSVYLSSFFSLPVVRSDCTHLSHEEVIKQLDIDTTVYDASLGLSGYFCELVRIAIKVETAQYATGIAWLRDLMYSSKFDIERLAVTVAKLQQTIPEQKRDGNAVLGAVSGSLLFNESSTQQASGLTSQIPFIPKLAQMIKDDPDSVVRDLEELRKYITDPKAMRYSVTGNVLAIDQPRSAWARNFPELKTTELSPVPWASKNLTPLGKNPVKKAVVVSLPTIESTFAVHTTKSLSGFDHPEAPALRLACEVLDGTESFLWKYIRGSGLAYGANMTLDLESGILSFSLYKSPNSFLAFQEAAKVVRGLADGTIPLEETAVDAAKSSFVYSLARSVSTPGRAAIASFNNQVFKGVPQDHGRQLLETLQVVTIDQVREAIQKHVLPLFDPASSIAVVVSAPTKVQEITQSLGTVGFAVENQTLDVSAEELEKEDEEDGDSEGSDISIDK